MRMATNPELQNQSRNRRSPATKSKAAEAGSCLPAHFAVNQVLVIKHSKASHAEEDQRDGGFARIFIVVAQNLWAACAANRQFLFKLAR